MEREALIAALRAEHNELLGLMASTADRLNTALRESNCLEIIGDPYRSYAVRDGIVALYDKGAQYRSENDRLRAHVAELEAYTRRENLEALDSDLSAAGTMLAADGELERMRGVVAEQRARAERAEARVAELAADVRTVLVDAHQAWDSDKNMRVGKLLLAALGRVPGYRPDTDRVSAALAAARKEETNG